MPVRIIRRGDRPAPADRSWLRAAEPLQDAEPPQDAEPSRDAGTGAYGRTSRAVTALAVLSLVLGTAQTGSPGATARLVGADDGPTSRAVARWACGVRELVVGAGLTAGRSPRPWLWARVAGDALDLALLGVTLARHPARWDRALAATAAVAGITVADIGTARRVSAFVDPPQPR